MSQTTINSRTYEGSFTELLENTAEFGGQVNVWTPKGAVVLMSEDDFRGLLATLEIERMPGLAEKIVEGLATPLSECLSEKEVDF
jgi:PHD/YefM family antitoxin component YafN of YafNO toxin-antitoxin module